MVFRLFFVLLQTVMTYKHFIAAVVAATMIACGGEGGGEQIGFETVKVERSVGITNENDAPQCTVSLQLAAAKGEPTERTKAVNETIAQQLLGIEGVGLKEAADSFANKYTADYRRNMAPLYREDRGDAAKRAWYEYHYNITSETKAGRSGVTVYTATVDYYEGGVHGITQRLLMNFDNRTGQMLTLDDVFVPGYRQTLCDLLLKALLKKTETENVDELRAKGYLYATDIFAPENFELGEDAVTFVYNHYEIAPYDAGQVELVIDNDELKDIWK